LSAKKSRTSTAPTSSEAVDDDGIPIDVDVQSIAESGSTREGKTADIDEFFGDAYECTGTNGQVKKHRKCKICV